MPVPTFTKLPPSPEFNDLVNKINTLVGELTQLLLNLDTLNVVSLNAEVITAGSITGDKIAADTITATNIAANAITASEIQAGAVTADKITVSQLSAISANLGSITAGTVTGALIQNQTSNSNKVYIDSTGFHANDTSGVERLTIGTTPAEGAKALIGRNSSGVTSSVYTYDTETVDGASRTGQYIVGPNAQYILLSDDGDFRLQNDQLSGLRAISSARPELNSGGGGWVSIAVVGGTTSTNGFHNHGITGGVQLATTADGSTVNGFVTWVESGNHNHTQT